MENLVILGRPEKVVGDNIFDGLFHDNFRPEVASGAIFDVTVGG